MQNSNYADFTIRIRFRIPAGHRIGVNKAKVSFTPAQGSDVILASHDEDKKVDESEWLILQRSGWDSAEAAKAAGVPLMDALRMALARFHLGVDLGCRALQGGGFSQAAIEKMQKESGRSILDDVHGPLVFATHLRPVFGSLSVAGGWPPISEEQFKRALLFALELGVSLSDKERTASDLFSASREARASREAQFVLLFAAVETLLENIPRPKPVLDHIDSLADLTAKADLEQSEKDSLFGSLQWLRSHSIRSSGRRFVRQHLADRKYSGQSAEELFLDCYDLRNRLMHGATPFPTPAEVIALVSSLDTMVCHLLAGPLLDFDIQSKVQ